MMALGFSKTSSKDTNFGLRVASEKEEGGSHGTTRMLPRFPLAAPVLFVLALVVRLPGIGRPEVGDESFAVVAAGQTLSGIVEQLVTQDAHPPLYFFLLHFWGMVSLDLWWLRTLSVILGALTCLLVYRIGTVAFDAEVGRCASLFLALSPLLIFISQYLRPYVLAIFLSTVSVLVLAQLLQARNNRSFTTLLATYTLLLALTLYTFYLSLFFVIGMSLFLLGYFLKREPRKLIPCMISMAVVGIAYLPWLPFYFAQMERIYSGVSSSTPLLKGAEMGFYIGRIHVGAIAKAFMGLLQFEELHTLTVRFSSHYSRLLLATGVLVGILALLALLFLGYRRLREVQRLDAFTCLVLIVTVLPPSFAAGLSAAGDLGILRPIAINLRYFGESAALFTLFLAGVVVSLRPRGLARGATLAVCLVFAVQVPYLYQYPFNDQDRITGFLDRNRDIGLVVSFPSSVEPFFDRANREEFRRRYQHMVLSSERMEKEMEKIGPHKRFYFFQITTAERMVQFPQVGRKFEVLAKQYDYVKTDERRVSDTLTVTLYERRAGQ